MHGTPVHSVWGEGGSLHRFMDGYTHVNEALLPIAPCVFSPFFCYLATVFLYYISLHSRRPNTVKYKEECDSATIQFWVPELPFVRKGLLCVGWGRDSLSLLYTTHGFFVPKSVNGVMREKRVGLKCY